MVAKRGIPSVDGVDFDGLNLQGVQRRRVLLGFEAVRTLRTKPSAPVWFASHLWSLHTPYMVIPSLSPSSTLDIRVVQGLGSCYKSDHFSCCSGILVRNVGGRK